MINKRGKLPDMWPSLNDQVNGAVERSLTISGPGKASLAVTINDTNGSADGSADKTTTEQTGQDAGEGRLTMQIGIHGGGKTAEKADLSKIPPSQEKVDLSKIPAFERIHMGLEKQLPVPAANVEALGETKK